MSAAAGGGQLPLALRFPPDQRLDAWVGDPAVAALLGAFARGEGVDAVFLEGPRGAGKTHLALAVCAAAEQAGRAAIFLPLASLGARADEALAFGDAQVVAIDGIEHVAGDRDAEVALFQAHNRVRAGGGGLLYTADAGPDALPLALADLRSRLAQCTRIALPLPDDGLRRRVLAGRAARRGLVLETAAIDWLLRRAERDLASLTALLDRIDRAALAAQRRVTVPFLRGLLGEDR